MRPCKKFTQCESRCAYSEIEKLLRNYSLETNKLTTGLYVKVRQTHFFSQMSNSIVFESEIFNHFFTSAT